MLLKTFLQCHDLHPTIKTRTSAFLSVSHCAIFGLSFDCLSEPTSRKWTLKRKTYIRTEADFSTPSPISRRWFYFPPEKKRSQRTQKATETYKFFFAIIQPCVRPPSEQEGELLCSLFLFHVLPFIIMEYKKISERLQSDQNVSWWFFPFHFSDGYHFYICGMRVVHGETTENNKMRGREKQANRSAMVENKSH